MPLTPEHHTLAEKLRALDARQISAPIEFGVGNYAFYPYRGFADIAERDDYRKLSPTQVATLTKIADDILAMQRTELFEAFVNDDGIIVVDKAQQQIEYSIDIAYNAARSRVEDIYPQVTYPQAMPAKRADDLFVRNDTAHEVAHHIDYWLNLESKVKSLKYLHSSSTLLNWLIELDRELHPDGVAALVQHVRKEEGYDKQSLLEEGYTVEKVDQMLRAESFAIACEYYYGSAQPQVRHSVLLEAYMEQVLDLDLAIQTLFIPLKEMERRRGLLRAAIHLGIDEILGEDEDSFQLLKKRVAEQKGASRAEHVQAIETVVLRVMARLLAEVRESIRLPAMKDA
ncbi:MAG: hypothetical protein FJX23_02345 [Alphaproteobacteria bacterium]|nr:hypothetical protein [Alphaproteobacteria bacterium]